jgi:dTDP-4-dehydrorhamnose reductase
MTALVIGASGLVGGALVEALTEAGEPVVGTSCAHPRQGLQGLDLRDAVAVRRCVEQTAASVLYVPASLTNVDYCELHPEESFAINVAGVRHLAACGVRLVYFSSDYVFAGDRGPYRESDPVGPLCVYGRHKVLAEEAVGAGALIIRTTVVYGAEVQGKNFVYRLRSVLGEHKPLNVPTDQIGSPTYAPNLARAAVALERRGARGVYHVAGPQRVSRYEFAREAAAVFGLDASLIRPVTTPELGQAAPRPLDAGMICDKAQAELAFPLVAYGEGLRLLRAELHGGDGDRPVTAVAGGMVSSGA